jgi:hypothetical protein
MAGALRGLPVGSAMPKVEKTVIPRQSVAGNDRIWPYPCGLPTGNFVTDLLYDRSSAGFMFFPSGVFQHE